MKLSTSTITTLLALVSIPSVAATCPQYDPQQQYINGDEIQKDGAFYRAQNTPQKGTNVNSSWFWENISECQYGLNTKRTERPHDFESSVTANRFLSGNGLTNYTEITQDSIYVTNKMEGGQSETMVNSTELTIKHDPVSFANYETKLKASGLQFQERVYGQESLTTLNAGGLTTPLIEADKLIINGASVLDYIQSLELRISTLEEQLAQ
ncbi:MULTISPECIES: hypothetical protein [unclassified Photobacterium]|uniref:hypothetical protein n=1 Tax=unclassified Photobacterium TaxID=2628852 RepID=UPI001EDE6422|nr:MULTISPECIES: hypothetical protein [unclassified Photobacterium]MCG3862619.1 hypothetical protein [Photobacterium sp. Ph6]MCG3874150.1 hypothetical protein [Photobacterium sp. Ph5]